MEQFFVVLLSLICFATQLTQVLCRTRGEYGIMVVERTALVEEQLFCIIYYPSLSNITSNSSTAERFALSAVVDLEEVNTCDPDNIPDVSGQIPLISSNRTAPSNCSIAARVENLQAG